MKVKPARAAQVIALMTAMVTSTALAQSFPSRTVRIVVPYAAGGVADNQARLLAQQLHERWGMPVITENKAGALTILGTDAVAKAGPDCHTLLLNGLPVALNAVTQQLPYDTQKDLAPVSTLSSVPNLLVVPASSPFKQLGELVEYARKNPGKLTYASTGVGGTSHLAAELLASMARIDVVHAPYRGGAAAYPDLLSGRVDFMFDSSSAENVAAGNLRALAIASDTRSARFPDLPTVAELGYPGFSASAWFAIWTTGGSPAACIKTLSNDIRQVLGGAHLKDRLLTLGADPLGSTPEEARRHQDGEAERWKKLVDERGIKMN
jgi:tripartite-type tricarboxylate transporter receptor subunit TctC